MHVIQDKVHQTHNLIESHLVSDEEKATLNDYMPRSNKVGEMKVKDALRAFMEIQNVAIKRMHKQGMIE